MKNFLLVLGFLCTSTLFAQFTYNDGGLGGIQSPNTSATGIVSFSAGYLTLASGDYGATALGFQTTASGEKSIAMGHGTIASGLNSTAMGVNSLASGPLSTAMGGGTIASGFNSTTMGSETVSSGGNSLAIGFFTEASDYASMAIGTYNKTDETPVPDQYSLQNTAFVIGNGTSNLTRSNALEVLFDGTTTIAGNVTAASFIGDGSQLTNTPQNIELYNPLSPSDSGIQSPTSEASGNYSLAVGDRNFTSGDYSFSSGLDNFSVGSGSVTMGLRNEAQNLLSVAIGQDNKSYADYALTMGAYNEANNLGGMALGFFNKANGNQSFAVGNGNETLKSQAIAMGSANKSLGTVSVAIGRQSTASGEFAIAIGNQFDYTGVTTPTYLNEASGNYSFVIGNNNSSTGIKAFTIGTDNLASARGAMAIGENNIASGIYSQALGLFSEASADNSFAIGNNALADGFNTTAIGSANTADTNADATAWSLDNRAFVIGNGYYDGEVGEVVRSDAFTVLFNGDATLAGNLNINSDARLKSNIISLGSTLAKVLAIDGKSYTMNRDKNNKTNIGVLAQDVQKVFPELVSESNDILSVNYQGLIPVLINAIKEQQQELNKLKAVESELELYKRKFLELESRISKIENN